MTVNKGITNKVIIISGAWGRGWEWGRGEEGSNERRKKGCSKVY